MISPFALDVSLALGALLIVVAAVGYLRSRTLGWAGLAIVLFGFLLVAGPAYSKIEFSVGADGLTAKLEQVQKDLKGVESQTAAVSTGVAEIQKRQVELHDEVRATRDEMLKRPAFDPALLERVKGLEGLLGGLQKKTDAIDLSLGKITDPKTGIEARMKELVSGQTKELADKLAGSIIRPR